MRFSLQISIWHVALCLSISLCEYGFSESKGNPIYLTEQDSNNEKHSLGGTCKARDWLKARGITYELAYLQYFLGNPVGKHKGVAHTSQFSLDLTWDLNPKSKNGELEFIAGFVFVTGTNLEKYTGSALPLTMLYGGRTFLVNNLYLKKAIDDSFIFKVGRIEAGDDFLTSELHERFLSLAFDSQIALYLNTPASGYPYATWGAYLQTQLSRHIHLNLGVYAANAKAYSNKYHGLNLSFNCNEGAEWIAEWVYNWESSNRLLPNGVYKIGSFYFSGTHPRFFGKKSKGNFGTYISIDQKLYSPGHINKKEDKRGLSAFNTYLLFPKDRNMFSFYSTGGLVHRGLFSRRPEDTTAIGLAYAKYSPVFKKKDQLQNQNPKQKNTSHEMLLEVNHFFKISEFFNVTPAIQYVIDASGYKNNDAVVLSIQTNISF